MKERDRELIYLASPYSHPDPRVSASRYEQVCRIAASILQHGFLVYSPIAHSHPIAQIGKLPTDHGYWREMNRRMLEHCERLLIADLPGWLESAGIAEETLMAVSLGKPIGLYSGWLNALGGAGDEPIEKPGRNERSACRLPDRQAGQTGGKST